jgi:hypothetical protein
MRPGQHGSAVSRAFSHCSIIEFRNLKGKRGAKIVPLLRSIRFSGGGVVAWSRGYGKHLGHARLGPKLTKLRSADQWPNAKTLVTALSF